MKLGIPVYERVNLLDVAGPLEMFYWAKAGAGKDLDTVILSEHGEPVTSINGVEFHVQARFDDHPDLDVLWVPGGATDAVDALMGHPHSPYLDYLRRVAGKATWVCSVCEGALLLARAGLLDGHEATTHWALVPCLKRFAAVRVAEGHPRFVVSGNRLTGGGISSGLDEALKLIGLLFDDETARSVQLTTQYYPEPPVSGQIPPADPCTMRWVPQAPAA